jgi:hypothetical protein
VAIFDFDAHVSRLAKLSERAPIAMTDERMKELVLPTLRKAMSAFLARFPEHDPDELRIYFLATPSATPGAGEQVLAPSSDVSSVMKLMIVTLSACMRRARMWTYSCMCKRSR